MDNFRDLVLKKFHVPLNLCEIHTGIAYCIIMLT